MPPPPATAPACALEPLRPPLRPLPLARGALSPAHRPLGRCAGASRSRSTSPPPPRHLEHHASCLV